MHHPLVYPYDPGEVISAFPRKFLESGIGTQRVPERIEPKKGRRNGRWVISQLLYDVCNSRVRVEIAGYSRRTSSELERGSLRRQVHALDL